MPLISQFATHFWSGCFVGCGVWDSREYFLSTIWIQKSERLGFLLEGCGVQSAEYRLAEREQWASTLLGLASPIFLAILTAAFKRTTTPALTARVGRRWVLDMVCPHGFLYCAIDCRLKAFGVGALCGDLCSESIQGIWLDVYLVVAFQHRLYTIRRKHLFA